MTNPFVLFQNYFHFYRSFIFLCKFRTNFSIPTRKLVRFDKTSTQPQPNVMVYIFNPSHLGGRNCEFKASLLYMAPVQSELHNKKGEGKKKRILLTQQLGLSIPGLGVFGISSYYPDFSVYRNSHLFENITNKVI